ncbi:hypothetical protein Dimus_010636 [Dionaea muscipula]
MAVEYPEVSEEIMHADTGVDLAIVSYVEPQHYRELDHKFDFQPKPEAIPAAPEVAEWNVDLGPVDPEEYMQKCKEEIRVYANLLQASSSSELIVNPTIPTSSIQNKESGIPTSAETENELPPA